MKVVVILVAAAFVYGLASWPAGDDETSAGQSVCEAKPFSGECYSAQHGGGPAPIRQLTSEDDYLAELTVILGTLEEPLTDWEALDRKRDPDSDSWQRRLRKTTDAVLAQAARIEALTQAYGASPPPRMTRGSCFLVVNSSFGSMGYALRQMVSFYWKSLGPFDLDSSRGVAEESLTRSGFEWWDGEYAKHMDGITNQLKAEHWPYLLCRPA